MPLEKKKARLPFGRPRCAGECRRLPAKKAALVRHAQTGVARYQQHVIAWHEPLIVGLRDDQHAASIGAHDDLEARVMRQASRDLLRDEPRRGAGHRARNVAAVTVADDTGSKKRAHARADECRQSRVI